MQDKEPFLSRWSRRKLEAKELAPASAPQAPELPAVAPAAPHPTATKPPEAATAGGITPEYREFFDPRVEETLRRTALKKLFSDPHFNTMDGLDTYIDDYAKADPIPEAMLRQLNQAKDLLLFDDEKQASERAGDETLAAAGEAGVPAASDTTPLPEPPPASAAGENAGAATGDTAAPPAAGSRNDQA